MYTRGKSEGRVSEQSLAISNWFVLFMPSSDIPETPVRSTVGSKSLSEYVHNCFGDHYFSRVSFVQKILIYVLLRAKKRIFTAGLPGSCTVGRR